MTKTKIRTLLVDDEPMARAQVRTLLGEESDIEVVGECASGPEAVSAIKSMSPDLVFLDVQMPEMDGFELARALGSDQMPAVVFVTAFDEYALRAFEIHALDYLLKPFSAARFKSAVAHAREHLEQRRATTISRELLALLPAVRPSTKYPERLIVKSSGRIYFVRTIDIDWCEAAGNYVRIHVGPQTHLIRDTMGHVESDLDPARFVRIHRSSIVNVDRIQELQPSFNGEYVVLLHGGTRLTLSRSYREELQSRLGKPF
jgi:two-component system LytT family response regulator